MGSTLSIYRPTYISFDVVMPPEFTQKSKFNWSECFWLNVEYPIVSYQKEDQMITKSEKVRQQLLDEMGQSPLSERLVEGLDQTLWEKVDADENLKITWEVMRNGRGYVLTVYAYSAPTLEEILSDGDKPFHPKSEFQFESRVSQ